MKETQRKWYLSALEIAQFKFDKEVSDLAEKIRQEVIIPACKQHKLEFISGMGTFFFTTQSGTYIYGRDYEGERLEKRLKPVFDLLNKEVSQNQCLGYYVSDVKKEDLK